MYIISSLACAFATSIESLVVLRFIQAVGSCAAAVASVAMVRDLFPVEDNAKVFSLLMLVVGVSPMVAPTVGGYVTVGFGWQAVFIVLAAMATVLLIAVRMGLPESSQPDASYSLKPKPILMAFLVVIREPRFYTYALSGAFSFAGLLAYVAGSPLLFMELFKVTEKHYGWIFAFLSVGLIGSSQVNTMLLKKYWSEQIILVALIGQLLTTVLFVAGTLYGWLGLAETIAFLFVFLSCLGLTFPNASALSMASFSKNAGSASALMGAGQMGLGALATIGLSLLNSESALPMAAVMAGSTFLALMVLLIGQKNIHPGTHLQSDEKPANAMLH